MKTPDLSKFTCVKSFFFYKLSKAESSLLRLQIQLVVGEKNTWVQQMLVWRGGGARTEPAGSLPFISSQHIFVPEFGFWLPSDGWECRLRFKLRLIVNAFPEQSSHIHGRQFCKRSRCGVGG